VKRLLDGLYPQRRMLRLPPTWAPKQPIASWAKFFRCAGAGYRPGKWSMSLLRPDFPCRKRPLQRPFHSAWRGDSSPRGILGRRQWWGRRRANKNKLDGALARAPEQARKAGTSYEWSGNRNGGGGAPDFFVHLQERSADDVPFPKIEKAFAEVAPHPDSSL